MKEEKIGCDDLVSEALLRNLEYYGNTIISTSLYEKVGVEVIENYCKRKIGKNIRIIINRGHWVDDCLDIKINEKMKYDTTVILELL